VFLYKHFLPQHAGSELDDIIRNIGFLLRTKQGCGSFLRGFGISETGYRTPEEMITELSREIRESLGQYEPRVEITEIEEIYGDGGRVSLKVHCRVRSTNQPLGIALEQGRREVEVTAPERPGSAR
jgi:phage baseplate assembly protein W